MLHSKAILHTQNASVVEVAQAGVETSKGLLREQRQYESNAGGTHLDKEGRRLNWQETGSKAGRREGVSKASFQLGMDPMEGIVAIIILHRLGRQMLWSIGSRRTWAVPSLPSYNDKVDDRAFHHRRSAICRQLRLDPEQRVKKRGGS